jgi:hypothetical protein
LLGSFSIQTVDDFLEAFALLIASGVGVVLENKLSRGRQYPGFLLPTYRPTPAIQHRESTSQSRSMPLRQLIVLFPSIDDQSMSLRVRKPHANASSDDILLVLIVRRDRPKPESVDKITDQQRADLHRSMTAYGGTYKFDGKRVEHNIDISWNEVFTGTTLVREIKKDGDRLTTHHRPHVSPVTEG